ncbi:MAG: phage head closure protein [Candidatus Limiplasma sp.]|nr:phage head closure protein [Candidatus Limiplasma sp.]
MSTPNVGSFRDRVTIRRRGTETVDRNGNASVAMESIRTIAAEVRHQSDREYLQSAGSQLETMVYIRCRTQADLQADDQLLHNGTVYEIKERHPLDDYGLYERIRAVAVRAERGA